MILYEEKIYYEEKFFSLGRKLYMEKSEKFKKAISSFIFLLFQCSKSYPSVRKILSAGSFGVKLGYSDPFKFLVSLEI